MTQEKEMEKWNAAIKMERHEFIAAPFVLFQTNYVACVDMGGNPANLLWIGLT